MRNRRLKRASDLAMKHEYLPEDVQAMQDPWDSYLTPLIEHFKKERLEREQLSKQKYYL